LLLVEKPVTDGDVEPANTSIQQQTLIEDTNMTRAPISFDFNNSRVLITGATSGIGKAVALAFAKAGAQTVTTGRSSQRGEQLCSEISEIGQRTRFLEGDLTNAEFCENLVARAEKHLGGIDIIVNCAGIIFHANAEQTTDEQWLSTMAINVNAIFYVCRAALKRMKKQGGVILNIASDAGLSASSGLCAYNTSKGAVIQMSRSMARDYGKHNIRVIPICPGDVDTPMLRDEFVQRNISSQAGLADSAQGVPLNRVCTAEEIASLVLYAASDEAGFMSGFPLVIDAANRA